MRRAFVVILAAALTLAGCSSSGPAESVAGATAQPGGQQSDGAANGGGGGQALQAAAVKVHDVCPLVPMDVASRLVPGGTPHSQTFPPYQCSFGNGTVSLQVGIGAYDTGGPVAGAEQVPGLAAGGYLEHLTATNTYLTVLLAPDQGELYVGIDDPSGVDHKNDVIDIAKAVLGNLH